MDKTNVNFQAIKCKLEELLEELSEKLSKKIQSSKLTYYIPNIWEENNSIDSIKDNNINGINVGNPFKYYLSKLDEIENLSQNINNNKIDAEDEVIYNIFPRFTTAFNHRTSANLPEFRDSGTILKTIALLPYLHSLGVTVLYCLPITSIGSYGKKGDLCSVYAINDPYKLDESLAEPTLNDLSIEVQFAALVEAAHLLGIKVVCEFIFRTASIDSDLALTHPNWFYWIDLEKVDSYRPPVYDEDTLSKIKARVESGDFSESISPDDDYIALFTDTPQKVWKNNGRIIGELENGKLVTIPGAFADWPPDDDQPLWSDVTYFKFFTNPKYNYIAYNTIRMYDSELLEDTANNQEDLFEYIANVIPRYISDYQIDGIMLDMGHALPDFLRKNIINKVRKNNSDFILYEENFIPNEKSRLEGFDALVGYLIFDFYRADKMRDFLRRLERNEITIPVFATGENHNTPRLQWRIDVPAFSALIYGISCFLPKSIRFIHSGFELLAKNPVNTGLGFSPEDIEKLADYPLPLFSYSELPWENSSKEINKAGICESIRQMNNLRNKLLGETITDYNVEVLENDNPDAISYTLSNGEQNILVIGYYGSISSRIKIILKNEHNFFINSITNRKFEVRNNAIEIDVAEYEFAVGLLV